jgi:hypothetical protein
LIILKSVHRTLVKRRIKKINTALMEQWANNETFELEKDLVVHTVALAILNPGRLQTLYSL